MKTFCSKLEIKNIFIWEKNYETNDEISEYSPAHGYNDIKNPFAHGEENIYFMLHQKDILLLEYEDSSVKKDYEYLYKKDEELKGDNITVENEGFVKCAKDFTNCKIILSKQKYHQFTTLLII